MGRLLCSGASGDFAALGKSSKLFSSLLSATHGLLGSGVFLRRFGLALIIIWANSLLRSLIDISGHFFNQR